MRTRSRSSRRVDSPSPESSSRPLHEPATAYDAEPRTCFGMTVTSRPPRPRSAQSRPTGVRRGAGDPCRRDRSGPAGRRRRLRRPGRRRHQRRTRVTTSSIGGRGPDLVSFDSALGDRSRSTCGSPVRSPPGWATTRSATSRTLFGAGTTRTTSSATPATTTSSAARRGTSSRATAATTPSTTTARTGTTSCGAARGDDVIYGGEGGDLLVGGPGNDYLSGGSQVDVLLRRAGQ